jgi:hypothetical protein
VRRELRQGTSLAEVAVDTLAALSSRAVTSPRVSKPWLLLPALFAIAWFLPVLWHGFRSDDFLSVYYFDRDAEAVKWGRVFEEWARPWFGVRDLYRPLVSLSFGVNWALSTQPFWFHLGNVLLLAGTAAAMAAAAARLASERPRLVAMVAGALVVLHPAAVEPTAWIAARTTGLQVFWSAVAYWSFLRWRDGEGSRWLPLFATALACASKEGAVLLPLSLVVLDLLRGSRPRWSTHLPFFVLVGGYLVFRKLLLGWFTTAEEGHTMLERVRGAMALFQQLVAPPSGGGIGFGGVWFALLFALPVLATLAARRYRLLWCLPWAVYLLLPGTTHVKVAADELAGRFVFDAVPGLALFVACCLDRRVSHPARRAIFAVGLLGILIGLGIASRQQLARYSAEDRLIAKVQQELLAKAAAAGPGRPFGVVGLPRLPVLHAALWGFLTQRPFTATDLPVVGLDNLLRREPAAQQVFTDVTAVHALVANGAGFGRWDDQSETLVLLPKAADEVIEFVRDPGNPRRFLPPRLLPPTAVAALEVVSPRPVAHWRAAILGNLEGDYRARDLEQDLGPAHAVTRCFFDTTPVLPWLVAAAFGGGPSGIELSLDEEASLEGVRVFAHASLPQLPLSLAQADEVQRGDLVARLTKPLAPQQVDYVLYLLLPTGLFGVFVPAGGTVSLDAAIQGQITYVCDVLGPCRVSWFWQEHEPRGGQQAAPPGRTRFDSCIVR